MQATRLLAERIAASSFDATPDAAREVAKQALLDYIGVTLAGMNEPLATILRQDARDEGGHPQARVLGTEERLATTQAALINGAAGHAHDYDDVHTAMSGHPTVPVAPAALAIAEHRHASGADLITAFATGVDTECILGRYAGPRHYADGWHATGTLGTFGAAAASARLLGLDAGATARALGIAGTRAAGLKSQFGTMCKPLHAGHAAATGLQSARLAGAGFSSSEEILETSQGFMDTQAHGSSEERFRAALEVPSFTQDICFKYHAACYMTHSAIEACRALCETNQFSADAIEDIEIRVDEGALRVCNIQQPRTGLEAKFSLRLAAAMAVTDRDTASIDTFDDALTRDPEIVRFRDRVRVVAHETRRPETVVMVRTRDGDLHEAAVNVAIPMRDLPAQWQKLERKFLALAAPVIGAERARAVQTTCRELESLDDVARLSEQLGRA